MLVPKGFKVRWYYYNFSPPEAWCVFSRTLKSIQQTGDVHHSSVMTSLCCVINYGIVRNTVILSSSGGQAMEKQEYILFWVSLRPLWQPLWEFPTLGTQYLFSDLLLIEQTLSLQKLVCFLIDFQQSRFSCVFLNIHCWFWFSISHVPPTPSFRPSFKP